MATEVDEADTVAAAERTREQLAELRHRALVQPLLDESATSSEAPDVLVLDDERHLNAEFVAIYW